MVSCKQGPNSESLFAPTPPRDHTMQMGPSARMTASCGRNLLGLWECLFSLSKKLQLSLNHAPSPLLPQFNSTMGLSAVRDRLSLASINHKPTPQDPPPPLVVYQVFIYNNCRIHSYSHHHHYHHPGVLCRKVLYIRHSYTTFDLHSCTTVVIWCF